MRSPVTVYASSPGDGAGALGGPMADNDAHTSDSARTRGRSFEIAGLSHVTMPLRPGSQSPSCRASLRRSAQHHRAAQVVNPDASQSFVWPDSGACALHASSVRTGWPDSAAPPPAGPALALPVHRSRRSKSGHGRSDCRPPPEGGNVRTETAEPPRIANCPMSHMDAGGNEWNNAPACVLSTV